MSHLQVLELRQVCISTEGTQPSHQLSYTPEAAKRTLSPRSAIRISTNRLVIAVPQTSVVSLRTSFQALFKSFLFDVPYFWWGYEVCDRVNNVSGESRARSISYQGSN